MGTTKRLQDKDKWDIVVGTAFYIGDMLQAGMTEAAKSGLVVLTMFAADMGDQDLPLSQGNIQHAKEVALEWLEKYHSPDYNMPLTIKKIDD
jgi:hypothetical protein